MSVISFPTSGEEPGAAVRHIYGLLGPDAVLLPLPIGKKGPWRKGWPKVTLAESLTPEFQSELQAGDVGVLLGSAGNGVCSIDCDSVEAAAALLECNPWLAETLQTRGSRGCNFWLRIKGAIPKHGKIACNGVPVGEWRADGDQTKIHGTHPDTGQPYKILVEAEPMEISFGDVAWPQGWSAGCIRHGLDASDERSIENIGGDLMRVPCSDITVEQVRELLSYIPPRPPYDDWLRIISAVWSVVSKEQGCALLSDWSPAEEPGEYEEKWKNRLTKIGINTLFHFAKLNGWQSRTGESAGSAKPFTIWQPAQFLDWQQSADACLLGAGLIERSEFTSLVGIGGLGKSRISLQLAFSQILSRDWCGLPTHGAPVIWLFISPENGISRWKTDLTKMLHGLTEAERAQVEAHLRLFAMTPEEDGDVCLADPKVCARLAATLATEKPGVVVFDPLADMIDGDESKTVDMVATLRRLRTIVCKNAQTAAVLVIHHSRTGATNVAQAGSNFDAGNFARGAKALYSRVRCELQLAPADRDNPNRLVLACGKASNGPKFETRGIVFDPETFTYSVDPDFSLDAWRDDVAGKRRESSVSIANAVEVVRELSREGEDVQTASIVDSLRRETGACAKTIQRRLNDAKKAGYLDIGSKRGTWRLGCKPIK